LRLLGWLFRGLLVVTIMATTAVAVIAVASTAFYELTRTTSGDLDAMIGERLPAGSPAEQIYAVLDEEGIEHGTLEPFAGDDMEFLYAGVRKGEPVILATVQNEGYTLELVDVQVAFVLDGNGVLARHVAYERHQQPEWLERNLEALTP